MILNAYAVLLGFIGLLRLLLGGTVAALALAALPRRAALVREAKEDRYYLLFLSALVLLGLNLASWPLFYQLLQSYVPQWPGTMCIYGVMQVGTGSEGPAGYLPAILKTLEVLKPVLIFATGAWFALYLVNRQTRTAPLTNRVLGALVPLGLLAVADAGLELGYLAIPKKEDFLSVGCCSAAGRPADEKRDPKSAPNAAMLATLFYAAHAGLLALEHLGCRRQRRALAKGWLGIVLAANLVCAPLAGLFLVHVAAPRIMGLPYHHCPYDLLERAPESVLAVGMYVFGSLCAAWGCVAGWLGDISETRPWLMGQVHRWLFMGFYCHLAALAMITVDLALKGGTNL